MKKSIIAAIIGGIILFLWQFLSWQALQLHSSQTSYTPQQNAILQCLQDNNLEAGEYFLPTVQPDDTNYDGYFEEYMGKPWATLQYHDKLSNTMPLNMVRGLTLNIVIVFLFCFLLKGQADLSFKKVILSSLSVGMISYLIFPYLNSVWFETNTIPDLIDAFVQWGLLGAWLGWYLPRK